jgi:hypothetical protein
MFPRFAPALVAPLALLLLVAGCAGAAPSATAPASPAVPVVHGSDPTPFPVAERTPAPEPVSTPVTTDTGAVDGAKGGPELVIEPVDDDTIQATLQDVEAKAWRLVIAGTGERSGDRWEIAVETGDVMPFVTATEIRDGEIVDVLDLSGFVDGTAAAGGCHSSLPVCLDSDGFRLPDGGDGRFSVRLDLPDAQVPLVIRGGTAAWDGEPFVLGDWRDTEPFSWGEG